jgi:hypothetical protein
MGGGRNGCGFGGGMVHRACWGGCFNEEIRKERAGSEDTRLKKNRFLCKENVRFCLTGQPIIA